MIVSYIWINIKEPNSSCITAKRGATILKSTIRNPDFHNLKRQYHFQHKHHVHTKHRCMYTSELVILDYSSHKYAKHSVFPTQFVFRTNI